MAVDPLFAQWLQAEADVFTSADAVVSARWGATAIVAERTTGIATRLGAQAEALRQSSFMSRGPFAIDVHEVVGTDWERHLGRVVEIEGADLDYGNGLEAFLIGVEADRETGMSALTVLCPLGSPR